MERQILNNLDNQPILKNCLLKELKNFSSEITTKILPDSIKSDENPFKKQLIVLISQIITKAESKFIEDFEEKLSPMECRLQSNEKMLENDKIKLKHLETFYNEINNKVEDLKLEYKEFQTNFNSKIEEKINEINLNNSTSLKTSLEEQCEYGLKFQGISYSKNFTRLN